jgi:ABC-type amino acid transport substrate-binding protein
MTLKIRILSARCFWLLLLAASASSADLPQIQKRGSLRVLVSADEDPAWFSLEGGPRPGFEREMLEGFARLHRLRLEVVPIKRFEDLIPTLVRGEGDVGAGLLVTEERKRNLAFTEEVMADRLLVVSRRPRPKVEALASLRAARVGVIPGTGWADATRAAGVPEDRIVELSDSKAVLAALRSGAIEATVMSVADLLLGSRQDPGLQAGLLLGEPGSSAWGVRKQDAELKAALDEYLRAVRQGPSWSRLVVSYFGDGALAVIGKVQVK